MERYLEVTRYLEVITVQDARRADRSCEALERVGIPVLIRHVEIISGDSSAPGFTLLVPSQHSNQAMRLMKQGSSQFNNTSVSE